jgi:hypothetical protein
VAIDWGPATSFAQPAWGSERRVITNVLFTDIVDSTVRAHELGDGRWLPTKACQFGWLSDR